MKLTHMAGLFLLVIASSLLNTACQKLSENNSQIISLDGIWKVDRTTSTNPPRISDLKRTIVVPGLMDLATPAIEDIKDRSEYVEKNFIHEVRPDLHEVEPYNMGGKDSGSVYWYAKTFKLEGQTPEVAQIKFHKLKYFCEAYLNGQHIGGSESAYTPVCLNVSKHIKRNGEENILMVAVKPFVVASNGRPYGEDGEIRYHFPGIYDSVELILSGSPYIREIQVAPDLSEGGIRIQTSSVNDTKSDNQLFYEYVIKESESGKQVAESFSSQPSYILADSTFNRIDFIAIPDLKMWSPESPFLYEIEVNTFKLDENEKKVKTDSRKTRFGMREFRIENGVPKLNGKTYVLRGTNVAFHRFCQDPNRDELAWDHQWVRKLMRKFKSMHYNIYRATLGFTPDFWYDIADEEGFLIQDEYPIWHGSDPKRPDYMKVENISQYYRDWIRERWNHPSIVIWDAANETSTKDSFLYKLSSAVRDEDLSLRPWDFGHEDPLLEGDTKEKHIYYLGGLEKFNNEDRNLKKFLDKYMEPVRNEKDSLDSSFTSCDPVIVNEYGWLWIRRDGNPTILTDLTFESLLGNNVTVEERREYVARGIALMTEVYRMRRTYTAVCHFCGLSSNAEKAYTSDNFIDLQNLEFEPMFEKYVKDAFSPVGLMIDFWEPEFKPGEKMSIPVYFINDYNREWTGDVEVSIASENRSINKSIKINALARNYSDFELTAPLIRGEYELNATLMLDGDAVSCSRKIIVE